MILLNTVHLNVVQYTDDMAPGRHDRDSVTATALRLLDEVGLPDLSMRRLAAALEVQPSALYWHFPSKQELLAAVADRILDGVAPQPDDDVTRLAARIRDALLAYRDGAEVVMSSIALGFGAVRAQALVVDALRARGLDDADGAASVIVQFTLGHALLVQQRMHAASHGATAPTPDTDDPAAELEQTFETGMRMLLSGLPLRPATLR